MAGHSQHHHQDSSSRPRAGSGQTIVRLHGVTEQGLSFFSRQRFDIAAELVLRVRRSALPAGLAPEAAHASRWAVVRAYVIECRPVRKPCGECLFHISVLLETALHRSAKSLSVQNDPARARSKLPPIFGLN